jgi:predicted ribonuclease toxin of YeeF-YezG toxin-antitoxin module
MVSMKIFTGDGSTKIFPIEFEIKGEDYIQIWLDNVAVNDRTTYDIINNSIVFLNDYIPDNGVKVEIVVATTAQEIADLNAPPSTVQVVVDNIDNLIDISDQVVSNMNEILQADDNAVIATQKASEALASANASEVSRQASVTAQGITETARDTTLGYRNEAEAFKNTAGTSATTATTQAGIATTKASEANASATASATSASEASASATSSATSASQALGYRNEALSSATLASGYKDTTYLYLEDAQKVQLEISTRRHEGEYISMDSSNEDFGDVLLSSPFSIENNSVSTDLAVSFGTLDCGSTI